MAKRNRQRSCRCAISEPGRATRLTKTNLERTSVSAAEICGSVSHRETTLVWIGALPNFGALLGWTRTTRLWSTSSGMFSLAHHTVFLPALATIIYGVWYRKVRDNPKGLLRMLTMLITTDFAVLRGGIGPLSAVDTGGATPTLKRRSFFERRVTLPVGTYPLHVLVNNRFAASTVTCAISQPRTSSERK